MSLAVDLSNYTTYPLRVNDAQCWKNNNVDRVIIQAVQGGGAYPPGHTPEQLQVCTEASLRTDGYILPFNGDSLSNLRAKHQLTVGYQIGRWWFDLEEPMGIDYVRFVFTEMDTWNATYQPVGLYTGCWFINEQSYGFSEFNSRPLWIEDNAHAAGRPSLCGGWTDYAMHQYALDATLCGISGIDISYVNPNWVEGGSDTNVIHVGEGMLAQMQAAGDAPLSDWTFRDLQDNDNPPQTYQEERCYGVKGLYISSNSSGQWVNAGPI